MLSYTHNEILESYIENGHFRVKFEVFYTDLKPIKAEVPQDSVLGPVLHVFYKCDILQPEEVTIATFADDTTVSAVSENIMEATTKLQNAIDSISGWTENGTSN